MLEGEQLCIAYVAVDVPRSTRQQQLRQQYNFVCQCVRCSQDEQNGRSVKTAPGNQVNVVHQQSRGGPPSRRTKKEQKERRAARARELAMKSAHRSQDIRICSADRADSILSAEVCGPGTGTATDDIAWDDI